MKQTLRMVGFGFLAWFIPFITAFLFYTPQGDLRIDIFLFKTIMIVVAALASTIILVYHYKQMKKDFLKEGVTIGVFWFVIAIMLDFFILLPMSGMTMEDYTVQIGMRYLVIPITSIGMAVAIEQKK